MTRVKINAWLIFLSTSVAVQFSRYVGTVLVAIGWSRSPRSSVVADAPMVAQAMAAATDRTSSQGIAERSGC